MSEKRNPNQRKQLKTTINKGVGGRHRNQAPQGPQGGYLDICYRLEVTIQDLENILHAPVLVETAKKIGVNNFVEMWKMVDALEDESIYLRLPSFSKLEIFQRNRMIIAMSESGKKAIEIRAKLKAVDIDLSVRRISRIIQIRRRDETTPEISN